MMFNKLAVRLLILLLWTACLLPCSAQAQSVKKILIQPFDVYSQTGASELQQSFLNLLKTELKKEQRLEVADHPAPAGSATQAGLKKFWRPQRPETSTMCSKAPSPDSGKP